MYPQRVFNVCETVDYFILGISISFLSLDRFTTKKYIHVSFAMYVRSSKYVEPLGDSIHITKVLFILIEKV